MNKPDSTPEKKEITVYFNGRPKVMPKETITFAEVISYAFEQPPTGDGVQFTVQYSRGKSDKPKGALLEDQSVKVKDGMEFDVTPTNRS